MRRGHLYRSSRLRGSAAIRGHGDDVDDRNFVLEVCVLGKIGFEPGRIKDLMVR